MRGIHHDDTSIFDTGGFNAADLHLSAAAQQTAQQVCLPRVTQCQLNTTHTVVLLPSPRRRRGLWPTAYDILLAGAVLYRAVPLLAELPIRWTRWSWISSN